MFLRKEINCSLAPQWSAKREPPLEGRWAAARRLGRVENIDFYPSVTFGDSSPTGEPLERKLQFIVLLFKNIYRIFIDFLPSIVYDNIAKYGMPKQDLDIA